MTIHRCNLPAARDTRAIGLAFHWTTGLWNQQERGAQPLTRNLRVLLQPLVIGRKPSDPLFPAKDMRWAWRRLCKAAGVKAGKVEGYVIHDTRRTAARTKRSAGVQESVTSAIMGWKPGSKMYARYGIVDRADMSHALQRSEQWEMEQRTATEQLQSDATAQAHLSN